VATVVNLLFNLVQPQLALFGEKDWQQLCVIRRMVRDFGMPIDIVGVPTVREADGLALSSRNQYLSAAERRRAPALFQGLQAAAEALRAGCSPAQAEEGALEQLRSAGFEPDYVAVRAPSLEEAPVIGQPLRILAAARLGATRLIDNIEVGREAGVGVAPGARAG
jgi:pantothenate synthetase (EC 6.3.2.1)